MVYINDVVGLDERLTRIEYRQCWTTAVVYSGKTGFAKSLQEELELENRLLAYDQRCKLTFSVDVDRTTLNEYVVKVIKSPLEDESLATRRIKNLLDQSFVLRLSVDKPYVIIKMVDK